LSEAVEVVRSFLSGHKKHYILTPNVDHIMRLQQDPLFKDCYRQASLVLPDGMPLVWASKILRFPLKERIAGIDLFFALCRLAAEEGYKAFFLGAKPEILKKAVERVSLSFENLQIAGSQHGYFHSESQVVDLINQNKPDLLFIGMGSPKQEYWIQCNIKHLKIKAALCVGGSFDILAGEKRRAPLFMHKIGMEWFWRLLLEPRRLWRRYLIEDMRFLKLVYLQIAREKARKAS